MTIESNKPEISIIMATYNRGHFIKETLTSIINQSFQYWECIIIDDGGSDNTFEIIKTYTDSDKRFRYYKRGEGYKKGLPGCRNKGLYLAKGNFIQFFDDDDVVHPDNLKTCFKVLSESNSYFCRYHKEPFIGKWTKSEFPKVDQLNKKDFELKDLPDMITGKIPFASCTVLWDKKCFEGIRFNEDLMYGEEWECYARILSLGFSGTSINQVLYYNRKHAQSNTGEFWANDASRRKSKVEATILVIKQLKRNNLIIPRIFKFFIQLGFFLKSRLVINEILNSSQVGKLTKVKYKTGYYFYPILRPFFRLKGKITKHLIPRGS